MTVDLPLGRFLKGQSASRNWKNEFQTWCATASDVIALENQMLSANNDGAEEARAHRLLLYALLAKGEQLLLDLAALAPEDAAGLSKEKTEAQAYLHRLEDALEAFHRPSAEMHPQIAKLAGAA